MQKKVTLLWRLRVSAEVTSGDLHSDKKNLRTRLERDSVLRSALTLFYFDCSQ